MKFLYASDLHGEIHLYQELLLLILSSSAEMIVLGGDLLPSFPPTKRYEDMIPNQKTFIDQFLLPFFQRMIETTSAKKIFLIPGNWDLGYFHLFRKPMDPIIDLTMKRYPLQKGYELIGYPFVPPTPFRPKDYERMDDLQSPWPPQKNPSFIRSLDPPDQLTAIDPQLFLRQRETIQEDMNHLPESLFPKRALYVMHSPPFGTRLDLIQGNKSAGSRSIRNFIETRHPLVTLHGHIHESPQLSGSYVDQLGETLAINPGQFSLLARGTTTLHAVTFEIENVEKTLSHTCFGPMSIVQYL